MCRIKVVSILILAFSYLLSTFSCAGPKQEEHAGRLNVGNLVFIQGGTFKMGSEKGPDIEKPIHEVKIDDFYMGKYEVTFAEYDKYCDSTGRSKPSDHGEGRGKKPVSSITWFDAIEYCNWLSKKEGLTLCYTGEIVICDFTASGYRFPTEAEWEYAAKGGIASKGFKFSGSNDPDKVAWFKENSGKQTHPVGEKTPNELGIHDMSGNVEEWCWDSYQEDYYAKSPKNNPKGPSPGKIRIVRGGAYGSSDVSMTPTYRSTHCSDCTRFKGLGFRVVRKSLENLGGH